MMTFEEREERRTRIAALRALDCWFCRTTAQRGRHQALLDAASVMDCGYRRVAEAWAARIDPGAIEHQTRHGAALLYRSLAESRDQDGLIEIRRNLYWWQRRIVKSVDAPMVQLYGERLKIWSFPKALWPLAQSLSDFQAVTASTKRR